MKEPIRIRRKAMKKGMLGLIMVLVMLAGAAEAVPLPPGDVDLVDTDLSLEVDTGDGIVQADCSGPASIQRSDPPEEPNAQGLIEIQTEILSLDLACSDGMQVRLSQTRRSQGKIQVDGRGTADSFFDVFTADSFFDVFVEIEMPQKNLMLTNQESAAHLQAKIVHIPPFSSPHFLFVPIILVSTQTEVTARLNRMRFHVKRPLKVESRGEVSPVFSCFYECKQERTGRNPRWLELTTLMLVNQSRDRLAAQIVFFNGREAPIAKTSTILSPQDLDEINVCETLNRGGVQVPSAGVIEVVLGVPVPTPVGTAPAFLPKGGAYGWIKNISGKFSKSVDEPFQGTVTGIAKTECRVVGPNVITAKEILTIFNRTDIKPINPRLIEDTADPQ
ncbi:MAG: hypothetical protein HY731_08095 [Candidatus Tectomicrobia bacterium]|nr:hypothetical protein [Candidatus Tectomicrobia bacterium]